MASHNIVEAFYGASLDDGNLADNYPNSLASLRTSSGLTLPDEYGVPRHRNLSAVLACDWFDTMKKSRRGKRLHCLLLKHWNGEVDVPAHSFEPFPAVEWQEDAHGSWKWGLTKPYNLVARFNEQDSFETALYTSDCPW